MPSSTNTLLINSTGQISLPYHAVLCVVSQPAVDETAFFKKEESPLSKETDIIVTSLGGGLTFTERYGSPEKAQEAFDGFVAAITHGLPMFRFPKDEEYLKAHAEKKAKKKRDEELQRPAYAKDDD